MASNRSNTQLTGSAGEFMVAGELARRGWISSITPVGIERTDILAQHSGSGQLATVQVKTANPGNAFRLSPKAEVPARKWTEWYVFVELRVLAERPRFFIVPTNVVSAIVYVGHRIWLSGTKRDGSPRKDSAGRAISANQIDSYEDAWDLLSEPASSAPVHVPDWVLERGNGDIGFPENHPGFP